MRALGEAFHRLDRADFIVDLHDRDKARSIGKRNFGIDQTFAAYRQFLQVSSCRYGSVDDC